MESVKCHSIGGARLYRSMSAVLPCGALRSKDVVWLSTNKVGRVVAFWSLDEASIVAQLELFRATGDNKVWDVTGPSFDVVDVAEIVDALIWVSVTPTELRVVPPCVGCQRVWMGGRAQKYRPRRYECRPRRRNWSGCLHHDKTTRVRLLRSDSRLRLSLLVERFSRQSSV